ncbi:MAG: putative UDP-4-amino-4-deoxy-L-arabinose--oxoglutarate aminotransferase [Nitrospira sp.]|jgi:dTDP-4-amino-4,6-dideoxygalactose transaminase|nr:putative UDP-4-amino-4-deoxy-L-arabinose--oxoglutarate aminotransferase [Nitrospira sp.]
MTMIPHSKPAIGPDDIRVMTEVLRSGQVAQGPAVAQFERGMAAYLGLQGGVAVNSGTVAIELALRALGVGAGDNIILPSYVCSAPWLAVQRVGAQARIVDIDPETYNLDPQRVRKARTSRTRAVIVPHMFGLPADLTGLQSLGIPLIEDCAQTLGATEQGRSVGTVGILTVCSFYATKLLCTGEGGMVLSNDADLLERVRALREYDKAPSLDGAAFNCKMTDLQGAMGIAQLNRLGLFLDQRAALAALYRESLPAELFTLPAVPSGRTHSYYRFVVRLPKGLQSADEFTAYLSRVSHRGVQCRKPVFRPLHRYLELCDFPASDEADTSAVSLPIYPSLTEVEIKQAAQVLREELP